MPTPRSFRSSTVRLGKTEFVDRVVPECILVLCEAEAPQPTSNVHDDACLRPSA